MLALSEFLLILLGGVGMTNIIVEGEIFVPVKNFLKKFMPKFFMKMLDCHQCCGFWSGIFVSFFVICPYYTNVPLLTFVLVLGQNFACGCAVSMMAVFWANLMLLIESKTVING